VVAAGTLAENGVFMATEVLAKHDENYMPPEVQSALDKSAQSGKAGGSAGAGKPGYGAGQGG
jgi:cytochrome c-type biogenesis protein CcmE